MKNEKTITFFDVELSDNIAEALPYSGGELAEAKKDCDKTEKLFDAPAELLLCRDGLMILIYEGKADGV